ncbi:MAG: Rv3235 family protein [Flaviflexus sp.]|nr:Rv3235 family protein [Flaviflexus sp.]
MIPDGYAERLALGAVEIIVGYRQPLILQRWIAPHTYRALARRAGLEARCGEPVRRPARVLASVIHYPAPGVCEASVVVHDTRRPRACAVRLELHRDRWRAETIDIA